MVNGIYKMDDIAHNTPHNAQDSGHDTSAQDRDALLDAVLNRAAFDGWSESTLQHAAESVGYTPLRVARAFPNGIADCIAYSSTRADEEMLRALAALPLKDMKIRERIETAVMTRLTQQRAHREAVRRALAYYALPPHAAAGMEALSRTMDHMWHAAGDRSTDFNFYSKRTLLAGVYFSTLGVWLEDETADLSDTRAFLQRRIENVLQFGKQTSGIMQKLNQWLAPITRKTAS